MSKTCARLKAAFQYRDGDTYREFSAGKLLHGSAAEAALAAGVAEAGEAVADSKPAAPPPVKAKSPAKAKAKVKAKA